MQSVSPWGNRIVVLHSTVTTAGNHLTIFHHDGSDRHAAFIVTGHGLIERELHELRVVHQSSQRCSRVCKKAATGMTALPGKQRLLD